MLGITLNGLLLANDKKSYISNKGKENERLVEYRELSVNLGGSKNSIVRVPLDFEAPEIGDKITLDNVEGNTRAWSDNQKRYIDVENGYKVRDEK